MIVVDASVLANMLLYADARGRGARAALARDLEWVAPEHWKAEVFAVARGLTLGGKLKEGQGARAVERLPLLGVESVPLEELLVRMWRLRDAVSGYDAAYVAVAEERGIPLVTADARLARAATGRCRVDLVAQH